jgi:hypothetical protein
LIHLEPLGWVGGPIILLDSRWLEVQGPTHPLQVVGKGLDSSCIVPSLRIMLSVRLVIIGTIVVIVPLLTSLLFKALTLLTLDFDPAACIFGADNVSQVLIILVSPSVAFHR